MSRYLNLLCKYNVFILKVFTYRRLKLIVRPNSIFSDDSMWSSSCCIELNSSLVFIKHFAYYHQSQWPRGLRSGSATAHLLGLWVWILPGIWMFVSCVCVCCQVEVSVMSWSLVQRSATDCDASLYFYPETSRTRRPWPVLGHSAT